jgi:hypothetical protein
MPSRLLLVIVTGLLLVPSVSASQTWRERYDRGELFDALHQLQPLVFEAEPLGRDLDPMAALYLATYYMNGWGVERDPLVACGLLWSASFAAQTRPFNEPVSAAVMALQEKTCAGLSSGERDVASQLGHCPAIGLSHQTVDLGDGMWLEASRKGFVVDRHGQRSESPLVMAPTTCAQHVLPLRARKLSPPTGSPAPARQLVEIFSWIAGTREGERHRGLMWTVLEIVEGAVVFVAAEPLAEEPGSAWPLRPIPEMVKIGFSWMGDGQVHYAVLTAAGERKEGTLRPYEEVLRAAREQVKASAGPSSR